MADTIVSTKIERDILGNRFEAKQLSVKQRSATENLASRREQLLDKSDDLLKWLEASVDEKKREEIETLGGIVRVAAKVDGWFKKTFPEPKDFTKLDTILNLYKSAWTIPEELARNAAGLWWVLSRKVRNEAELPKKKKLAEAFLKDPVAYIEDNQDLFSSANLEKPFVDEVGGMILTEGLVELKPADAEQFNTALEFTRTPSEYPINSPEFKAYADIRKKVLLKKLSQTIGPARAARMFVLCPNTVELVLQQLVNHPNAPYTMVHFVNSLGLPPAEIAELFGMFHDSKISIPDILGNYNNAHQLAQGFVRTQGLVDQYKRNNIFDKREIVRAKTAEVQSILLPNIAPQIIERETEYLIRLYGEDKTDDEINTIVSAEIATTGINPIGNLLTATLNDMQSLRWLLTNPVGTLQLHSNEQIGRGLMLSDIPAVTRLRIVLLLHGGSNAKNVALANPRLIEDLKYIYSTDTLQPPLNITNINELDAVLTHINSTYELNLAGDKKNPGINERLKVFEESRSVSRINVEVYSYLGLPPFASISEIDSALKPFASIRDAHAKVFDLKTGNLNPKFVELARYFQRLEAASPGLLEELVSGAFFFYRHKDRAGVAKDLASYKGQYYRDLNALKGGADNMPMIDNPVRHALDLDYTPPEHGIKHYFDRIYGAAKKAGINQKIIDEIIVDRSAFLKATNAEGTVIDVTAKPDEMSLLAMYVKDGNRAVSIFRKLNEAVNTATAVKDKPEFKAAYDNALVQSIKREENISTRAIESKIVAMRKDKSPASYLSVPEEILHSRTVLQSYRTASEARLSHARSALSIPNTTNFINNAFILPGNLSLNNLLQDANRIGSLFLQSPVDAKYFDDLIHLMSVSNNVKAALFSPNFRADLANIDSPLSKEVLSTAGLSKSEDSVKRMYLRGISGVGTTLFNQVLNQNTGVFGVVGNLAAFNAGDFLRYVYMFFGNPLDYSNGSESLGNRLNRVRSSFTAPELNLNLQPGTKTAVDVTKVLLAMQALNDNSMSLYQSKLQELSSPSGDIRMRGEAVRDIRANKKLIEIYGKGGDARTLAIISANMSLNAKIGELETSEDRLKAAYGDKLQ